MKQISTLLCIFFSLGSFCQNTEVIVKLPKDFSNTGATLTLKLDADVYHTVVSSGGIAKFVIPVFTSDKTISIEYSFVGFVSKNWQASYKLIGSDKAEIVLKEAGGLLFKQWPKAEFESSTSKMDIKIDGKLIGNTFCSKTLEPDSEHTIEWIKDGNVACKKSVTLTYNQKRRYTCNSDNSTTED